MCRFCVLVRLKFGVHVSQSPTVIGFDVSEATVKGVNAGLSHIKDLTNDDVRSLTESGRLEATTDMRRLAES